MIKLGYNTWSMPTLGFEDAVLHLARLGFDSIEVTVSEGWSTDVLDLPRGSGARWRTFAADAGINITSLTANTAMLVDDQAWRPALERLTRSLELAAEVARPGEHIPISLTASGLNGSAPGLVPLTSDVRWADERGMVVDRFAQVVEIAQNVGARVALEPHIGTIVRTVDRAEYVLDQIGGDAIGLNLDISHFAAQGADIGNVVAALAPHAIASEVKDVRGIEPNFEWLIPGEGEFDYVAFLQEMERANYTGSIAVEVSVMRQAKEGYDPYDAAARSYEVLAKAWRTASVERPARSGNEGAGK